MKKKFLIKTLVVILIFSFIFSVPVLAQQVTALTEGNSNVLFSNGYRGYCIDMNKHYAEVGNLFEEVDTSWATSNVDGSDISGYLKALFVIKFDYLFVSDGNGSYELDFDKKDSFLPAVIWNFSDNRYIWGEQKNIVNEVKAYDGPAIPDEGYTITLDNGDIITFYFLVMHPEDTDIQDFFAYKIAVGQEETTTEPEESTTEPEESTTEPEESTTEPEESTTEPEETTTEPEETTTEPEETTTEPEESTTEPDNGPSSGDGGENPDGGSIITPPGSDDPDGNNPDDNNPDDNNPDSNNPDGNNPDGNNPDGNNPDGNNPDGNENIPNTHGVFDIGLWVAIAILSMSGVVFTASRKKRNEIF